MFLHPLSATEVLVNTAFSSDLTETDTPSVIPDRV